MSDEGAGPAGEAPPLVWRVPAPQTALLFLAACVAAVVGIYLPVPLSVKAAAGIVGLLVLVLGVGALRMVLYVDDEGVAVRGVGRESWLPWADITAVTVASSRRGSDPVLRFVRRSGPPVETWPSLLAPTKPMNRRAAEGRLKGIAEQIARRGNLPRG